MQRGGGLFAGNYRNAEHRAGLVFSFGMDSAGVSSDWAALDDRPGVNFLHDLSVGTVEAIARHIERFRRANDIVIVSIHWGSNWGYEIGRAERDFAHGLVDATGVNLVHGHSSHHPKGIEVYRGAAILYGCGDFLNDYEGISGYEWFRPDLVLMYLATFAPRTLELARLSLIPMQIRHFSLRRAGRDDTRWIEAMLDREGRKLGSRVTRQADDTFLLHWDGGTET
jgi:poly-gamma-glutamate synthesis protein (capsule biosynthesis protein)